jgi:bifunctional oligoribonuclease and PAP phosphatase NrnA
MPLSLIDTSRHIVLIAHIDPDADSLGSACAFYSHLIRTHTKVTLFCVSEKINPNLSFLPWFDRITDRFPEDADCMISFDCGSYGRLGIEKKLPLINFDHHLSNDFFGTHNKVDTSAISTTEVVYDYFVANRIKINGKMANALYAGLLEDSKCFSLSECHAKTFAMAQSLIDFGADHTQCVEWLFQRRSLASLRVRGYLFEQMKLLANGKLALFELPLSLLEESGATIAECKGVLDDALNMRTVHVAVMVAEHPKGGVKLSLRSDGVLNVAEVIHSVGGGGHLKRAGARIKDEKYHEQIEKILSSMIKELM